MDTNYVQHSIVELIESQRGRTREKCLAECEELVLVGEYMVAIECLCVGIYEDDSSVSSAEYAQIGELVRELRADPKRWQLLSVRDQ
jgi:hypothetical protein